MATFSLRDREGRPTPGVPDRPADPEAVRDFLDGLKSMDEDIEGEDDPEYARPSEAEGWRRVCTGIVGLLLGLALILAFFAAVAGLAQYLGGPAE